MKLKDGCLLITLATVPLLAGCGGSSSEGDPVPRSEYAMLDGQRVLVLPVQYVRRSEGPWIGGARNEREAARQAEREIAFALREEAGRSTWILPEQQVAVLERRPMIDVDPYSLSAERARRGGGDFDFVRDPLYGELRPLVALFESRLILWPIEVYYEEDEVSDTGRVVIRTLVIDGRSGAVLYQGQVRGEDYPKTSPAAMASAAQAFAIAVNP